MNRGQRHGDLRGQRRLLEDFRRGGSLIRAMRAAGIDDQVLDRWHDSTRGTGDGFGAQLMAEISVWGDDRDSASGPEFDGSDRRPTTREPLPGKPGTSEAPGPPVDRGTAGRSERYRGTYRGRLAQAAAGARRRGIEVSVARVGELARDQGWRCALSGDDLHDPGPLAVVQRPGGRPWVVRAWARDMARTCDQQELVRRCSRILALFGPSHPQ